MYIKALLFDLDGTLANTLPLCIKTYQHAFEHYTGRTYTEQEVTAHFGLTEEGIFRRIMPDQWEAGLQHYYEIYEKLHDECKAPFSEIETALQFLKKRGILMGVVTGKGEHTAAFTLDYLGIAHYFDMVEAGRPDAIVKAEAMRRILEKWHIDPQYAAYIGDTDTDMEQATAAGVLPLGACWAETTTINEHNTIQPYAVFPTVKSFIAWLDQNIESDIARV